MPLLQLPFLLEPEVGEALLVVEEQTARASAQQEPPLPALPNSFRTCRKISFPRQPAFRNSDKTAPFLPPRFLAARDYTLPPPLAIGIFPNLALESLLCQAQNRAY